VGSRFLLDGDLSHLDFPHRTRAIWSVKFPHDCRATEVQHICFLRTAAHNANKPLAVLKRGDGFECTKKTLSSFDNGAPGQQPNQALMFDIQQSELMTERVTAYQSAGRGNLKCTCKQ
jgi:hypothetical protein